MSLQRFRKVITALLSPCRAAHSIYIRKDQKGQHYQRTRNTENHKIAHRHNKPCMEKRLKFKQVDYRLGILTLNKSRPPRSVLTFRRLLLYSFTDNLGPATRIPAGTHGSCKSSYQHVKPRLANSKWKEGRTRCTGY
jgi:hypothetical protein